MRNLFDLGGRIALVTGSTRGLGLAIARGLADAGATVVLHGREQAALDARAAEFRAAGLQVAGTAAFDVTDAPAVGDAFVRIAADHGRLDILVNNAGVILRRPVLETTDEEWQRSIDTDLTSCFRLSREAARIMIPAGRGRIVMISSIMGLLGRPTIPGYITSKAGLHGLVRALASEFAPHGINVNAIAPGYFPTDATATLHADAAFQSWIAGRAPLARWGRPEELAGPAIFLASDASSYMTGQVLAVDGGITAVL